MSFHSTVLSPLFSYMHTLLKHVGVDVNVIIAGVKIDGIFSVDFEFQEIKNCAFLALQEGFICTSG